MNLENGYLPRPKGFSTTAIRHAQNPEDWDTTAVITPIVTSTIFKKSEPDEIKKYNYSRDGTPTRAVLEKVLAKLDNCEYSLTFASRLGTVDALLHLLKTGDSIIVSDNIYGGTSNLISQVAENYKIDVCYVDMTDTKNIENFIKPETKLILCETPTNPTLKLIDIRALVKIAKSNNTLVCIDNTLCTPYFQRPHDLGVDLVVYSLSKYMNGHSDVLMGAVTMKSKELYDKIRNVQSSFGAVPSPYDCYQVLRGLKTLSLRMEQHAKNSLAVADFLEKHALVEKVLHPGLSSHPQHQLSKSQTSGHSGIVSFYIKGGYKEAYTFMKSLKIIQIANSLGGTGSLVSSPAKTSHVDTSKEVRDRMEITDNLIRLSIGIEETEDLIDDINQALEKVSQFKL